MRNNRRWTGAFETTVLLIETINRPTLGLIDQRNLTGHTTGCVLIYDTVLSSDWMGWLF